MQGVNCAFFRAGVKFYVFKRAASPFFSCPGMLIAGFCGLSITTLQTQLGYEEQPWAKGAAVIMSIMMMKNGLIIDQGGPNDLVKKHGRRNLEEVFLKLVRN